MLYHCEAHICMHSLLVLLEREKLLTSYRSSALCGLDRIGLPAGFSFKDCTGLGWGLANSDRIGLHITCLIHFILCTSPTNQTFQIEWQ